MTDRNSQSKNKLKCIKRKLSETNDKKQDRLLKHRDYSKRVKYTETANERASRLANKRHTYLKKNMSEETADKRRERLANKRDTYKNNISKETTDKRKERLANKQFLMDKKRAVLVQFMNKNRHKITLTLDLLTGH